MVPFVRDISRSPLLLHSLASLMTDPPPTWLVPRPFCQLTIVLNDGHCEPLLHAFPSFPQGHIDLTGVGKRGYHVPRKGTVQVVSVTRVMVKIELLCSVCVGGGGGVGGCYLVTL